MRALIVIDHDIVIRHFVQSGAFAELERKHEVAWVFPELGNKRVKTDTDALGLDNVLHLKVDSQRHRLWSWLAHVYRLRWRPGKQWEIARRFTRGVIGPGHVRQFTLWSLPVVYQWFRWRTLRRLAAMPNTPMVELLDSYKPDVVLHPTPLEGPFLNDLMVECQKRGIPMVAIMNSWDNPSTKSMYAHKPDWLLVWARQTYEHAVRYLQMDPKRIVEFGAAQFDVYREPPRIDRATFCQRHGIDPARKILLYAGSSKGTHEFEHLKMLDEAVDSGYLRNVTILYRPHPWGGCGIDGHLIADHPWKHVKFEESSRLYVESVRDGGGAWIWLPDYADTRDLIHCIDALITPLSTMLIEASYHGVPVMCFLPEDEKDAWHFQTCYELVHFQELYRMPEFMVTAGSKVMVERSKELLERSDDAAFCARLKDVTRNFIEIPDRPWGERLVEFLETRVLPAARSK